jgi:hypothetical protein
MVYRGVHSFWAYQRQLRGRKLFVMKGSSVDGKLAGIARLIRPDSK